MDLAHLRLAAGNVLDLAAADEAAQGSDRFFYLTANVHLIPDAVVAPGATNVWPPSVRSTALVMNSPTGRSAQRLATEPAGDGLNTAPYQQSVIKCCNHRKNPTEAYVKKSEGMRRRLPTIPRPTH